MCRTYQIHEVGQYGVIYCLTSPSGKKYIGQSWNVASRWSVYRKLQSKLKRQPKLYNALKKYGPENFTFEIIDICESTKEMDRKEEFYIMEVYDSMNVGYNSISGGDGFRLSQEMKDNISKAKKEYFKTHDNNRKGKTQSAECKRKISETKKYKFANGVIHNWKGKTCSKEMVEKRIQTRITNGSVYFYKIIFPSGEITVIQKLKEFCENNDINYGTMYAYARRLKKYKGYSIKILNPEEILSLQGLIDARYV